MIKSMLKQKYENIKKHLQDLPNSALILFEDDWQLELSSTLGPIKKKVRLSTKLIPNSKLIRQIKNQFDQISGLECLHLAAALDYSSKGFRNILVQYPIYKEKELIELTGHLRSGSNIYLPLYNIENLKIVNKVASEHQTTIPVYLEFSFSNLSASPIQTFRKLKVFIKEIKKRKHIQLKGIKIFNSRLSSFDSNGYTFFPQSRTNYQLNKIKRIIKKMNSLFYKNKIDMDFISLHADTNHSLLESIEGVTELHFEKCFVISSIFQSTKFIDQKSRSYLDCTASLKKKKRDKTLNEDYSFFLEPINKATNQIGNSAFYFLSRDGELTLLSNEKK